MTLAVLVAVSGAAAAFVQSRGYTLYYGDAQAHLNIARRVMDSRTPGWNQLGTVWLPLPHLLMVPLVGSERMWSTGLAGAIPSAICYVLAGVFLYSVAVRVFHSRSAALPALAVFALNPNLLYLQATPMTEPVYYASSLGLIYFAVRFARSQSAACALAAALAALAGTLTRYEAWFLLPFFALYVAWVAERRRAVSFVLFCAVSSLGPLYWLAHNWWYYGDILEFYSGPYSARAIQGAAGYPGYQDWVEAGRYFWSAVVMGIGKPATVLAALGSVVLVRRRGWLTLLLVLPAAFYLASIHSSGTPIFVPRLWPFSYYNTRYGLAMLPLAAFAAGALVLVVPGRWRPAAGVALTLAAFSPWLLRPSADLVVTWKESQVNSEARRAWTHEAADFLHSRYRPGEGIFTNFGDVTGIYCEAGIPLAETLSVDNRLHWLAAVARPELFLWEQWAVTAAGDKIQFAILRSQRLGATYELVKTIMVNGAPVIEIYHRSSFRPPAPESDEDPVHQGPWSTERLPAELGQ